MFQTADIHSQIIAILRDYGAVPLDFLAKRLGRQKSEITENIDELVQKDVLEIRDEKVNLAHPG